MHELSPKFTENEKSRIILMDFTLFAAGGAAGRSSPKDFKAFWSWPSRARIFPLYFSFTFSGFAGFQVKLGIWRLLLKLTRQRHAAPVGTVPRFKNVNPTRKLERFLVAFFLSGGFGTLFIRSRQRKMHFFENFEENQGFPDFFEKFLKKSAGFRNFL